MDTLSEMSHLIPLSIIGINVAPNFTKQILAALYVAKKNDA